MKIRPEDAEKGSQSDALVKLNKRFELYSIQMMGSEATKEAGTFCQDKTQRVRTRLPENQVEEDRVTFIGFDIELHPDIFLTSKIVEGANRRQLSQTQSSKSLQKPKSVWKMIFIATDKTKIRKQGRSWKSPPKGMEEAGPTFCIFVLHRTKQKHPIKLCIETANTQGSKPWNKKQSRLIQEEVGS